MRLTKHIIAAFFAVVASYSMTVNAAEPREWANHKAYEQQNSTLSDGADIVLLGNSITELWVKDRPQFFEENSLVGRGISGQVTGQMLCRMQADVVRLNPRMVVIMAGINDLCLNQGPTKVQYVVENLKSMIEVAQANGIEVVMCSVTPADHAYWRPEVTDLASQIVELNASIQELCRMKGIKYVDYYSALVDEKGALRDEYGKDGIHPNANGYAVMEPILLSAIGK